MLKKLTLPNGYVAHAFEGSEAMVDEIWTRNVYGRHATIAEGMTVLDIGANQGFFSLLAASRGARVFAYEPLPETFEVLRMNIEANGLVAQIVAYNEAIAARDGRCQAFVPTSDKLIASGSVTLDQSIADKLTDLVSATLTIAAVHSVSLKTALGRVQQSRIDLLKFDCEGSELEAIKATPPELFEDVQAVVMETHGAYAEMELYQLLQRLGFSIHQYEQLAGPFQTGYLFASRDTALKARTQPVAILSAPSFVLEGEPLIFEDSRSFATRQSAESLAREWTLDGAQVAETEAGRIELGALAPGLHQLRLQVRENGESDDETCDLFCLERHYLAQSAKFVLPEQNLEVRVMPAGTTVIKVPHKSLPAFSVIRELRVLVRLEDSHLPVSGHFEFNGTRRALTERTHEFSVDMTPAGVDVLFTLSAPAPLEFTVCWWPESPTLRLADGAEQETLLGPLGYKAIVTHEKARTYRISPDMLPTTWRPRQGVVGIAAAESFGESPALVGQVTIAGKVFELGNWYTEVRFPIPEDGSGIALSIDTFGVRRELALAWWGEA